MKRLKAIAKIVKYFISGKLLTKIDDQIKLVKVLSPFVNAGFIDKRTYLIYIFSYLCRSFSVEEKRRILLHNYCFLKQSFDPKRLQKLFYTGITCFRQSDGSDVYEVALSSNDFFEFEGSMSLNFKLNDVPIFDLAFTFAPGDIFGVEDETVIYISGLQGTKNEFESVYKTTKYFKENAPAIILMKVLEAIADCFKINKLFGISVDNQLSFGTASGYQYFYDKYDEFWKNVGGVYENGNYVIPLPIPQKDILLIKQKHRNRTLKKREVLKEIYWNSCELMSDILCRDAMPIKQAV